MLIFWWLCLSAYILVATDLFAFSLGRRGWQRFAATFLLFYGQIVGLEFLLGLGSVLYGYALAGASLAVSTALIIFVRRRFGPKLLGDYLARWRNERKAAIGYLKTDPALLALSALALLFLVWIIFLGIIFPVVDWDGNTYHLTYVAELIQNHKLYDAPSSVPWLIGYPKGGELIQAWTMLTTHRDMLVELSQIPFLGLGVYALYEIAKTLGAAKRQARFAAVLFFFMPIIVNQIKTTYVDVIACSLFLAGLAMVVRKNLGKLDLVLTGIIFSLLISIKDTGFLYVAGLLPLLAYSLWQSYGRKIRPYFNSLLLVGLPTIFGFYWYVKDYLLYGSPIYPFGLKIAGFHIFPGKTFQEFAAAAVNGTSLPHGCIQRIWYVWTEQKDWYGCFYNYDTNYAGLGPIWFIILLPALVVSMYFAVKKQSYKYLAVSATILGMFAVFPSNYYSRYTMFIAGLGAVALAIVLSNISRVTANFVKLLAIVLAALVVFANFSLCNFPPRLVKAQLKSFVHGTERGDVYSNVPGTAFRVLEDRVHAGEVVDYDSSPYFIYPLWRADFSDKVIYIKSPDSSSWFGQLKSRHVRYVFTLVGSRENGWAKPKLNSIYKDQMYEIFKVY